MSKLTYLVCPPHTRNGFYSRYNNDLVMRKKPIGGRFSWKSVGGFWTQNKRQSVAVMRRLPKGAWVEVLSVTGWPKRRVILKTIG